MRARGRPVSATRSGHETGRRLSGLVAVSVLLIGVSSAAAMQKEGAMTTHASGAFDVKVAPQTDPDSAVSRMTIDKQYHGDLEGTGKGQMLASGTEVKDTGVYVALEKVDGTLHGKRGTFLLQHSGVMVRGATSLTITVVPESGTGELTGLSGRMDITIENGKHFYTLDYVIGISR